MKVMVHTDVLDVLLNFFGSMIVYGIIGIGLHGLWEMLVNPISLVCVAISSCIVSVGYGYYSKNKTANIILFWVAVVLACIPLFLYLYKKLSTVDDIPFLVFLLTIICIFIVIGSLGSIFTREFNGLRYYGLSLDYTSKCAMYAAKDINIKIGDFVSVYDGLGHLRTALVSCAYGEIDDAWPLICPRIIGLASNEERNEWIRAMKMIAGGKMDPRVKRLIEKRH